MDEWEKKTRRWFRRHGWATHGGYCSGQVWLKQKRTGVVVEINPCLYLDRMLIDLKHGCALELMPEEAVRLADLAKHNYKAYEEARRQKERERRR